MALRAQALKSHGLVLLPSNCSSSIPFCLCLTPHRQKDDILLRPPHGAVMRVTEMKHVKPSAQGLTYSKCSTTVRSSYFHYLPGHSQDILFGRGHSPVCSVLTCLAAYPLSSSITVAQMPLMTVVSRIPSTYGPELLLLRLLCQASLPFQTFLPCCLDSLSYGTIFLPILHLPSRWVV